MTRKWRLYTWGIYTAGSFLILLIAYNWKIALSVSIICGFVMGLMNEIIQWLTKLAKHLLPEDEYKR